MKFGYVITYVADVAETVKFWESAFGIKTRFVDPSGQYAELETGITALAFAAHAMGDTNLPNGYVRADLSEKPLGVELALVTSDVSAATTKAVLAGGVVIKPPAVKPWGQTVSYVRTPDGSLVELCSPIQA